MAWSAMKDMELSDEDKLDMMVGAIPCAGDQPDYPYGLRISLTERELEKLGLKPDCDIGDIIDLRAFAEVTSVSTERRDGKDTARVELQIQRLALENEAGESTDPDDA
jgi:hypothetical protein